MGSGSGVTTSTTSLVNPSISIVLTSSTALLTALAILITKEYKSKLKLCFTKLRDWVSFITIHMRKPEINLWLLKKIDEKEGLELKKIYNHYIVKR